MMIRLLHYNRMGGAAGVGLEDKEIIADIRRGGDRRVIVRLGLLRTAEHIEPARCTFTLYLHLLRRRYEGRNGLFCLGHGSRDEGTGEELNPITRKKRTIVSSHLQATFGIVIEGISTRYRSVIEIPLYGIEIIVIATPP